MEEFSRKDKLEIIREKIKGDMISEKIFELRIKYAAETIPDKKLLYRFELGRACKLPPLWRDYLELQQKKCEEMLLEIEILRKEFIKRITKLAETEIVVLYGTGSNLSDMMNYVEDVEHILFCDQRAEREHYTVRAKGGERM